MCRRYTVTKLWAVATGIPSMYTCQLVTHHAQIWINTSPSPPQTECSAAIVQRFNFLHRSELVGMSVSPLLDLFSPNIIHLPVDVLMNPDRTPKACFTDQIARRIKWAWIGILKPTEPHSPWEACSVLNTYCPSLLRGHLRRKLHHISVIRGSSRTPAKTHAQQFRFSWTIGVTPLPFNWMLTIRECICVSRFLAHVILT